MILLGVAEVDDEVIITGVDEAPSLAAGLESKARDKIVPPIQLGAVEIGKVDNRSLVVCVVPPQPPDRRPFRVGRNGPAYIRSADGDYQLSPQEELYLIGERTQPADDRAPVPEADVDRDLVPELLEQYLQSQRDNSTRLTSLSRDELLVRTNVVDHETGLPTVAAIYAMGIHPQQFLPHTAVKAYARSGQPADSSVRLTDRAEFSGPLPDLLDAAVSWVDKHLMHAVRFENGHGYNSPELPLTAVREGVANALVHRDLSPASFGSYTMIVKEPSKLIIENPGGLWGLTERELGRTSPRARNAVLYRMASAITARDGKRVIEGYATGIPAIKQALHESFLPAPFFQDEVVRFKMMLSSAPVLSTGELAWLANQQVGQLTIAQKHALVAMRNGQVIKISEYRARFPMDFVDAREELQQLVLYGLARPEGSGEATGYVLNTNRETAGPEDADDRALTAPAPSTPTQERSLGEGHRDADSDASHGFAVAPNDEPSASNGRRQTHAEQVIAALRSVATPLSRKDLAQLTRLTPTQVYHGLRKLQESKQITTDRDPTDGRIIRYFPSSEG